MGRVESDQRVKGRAKQVRADRQVIPEDQPIPLTSSGPQKRCPEEDGQPPPELKGAWPLLAEGALRQHDREAARQEADGRQNWHLEDLRWGRAAYTLAYIKQISHDKNCEQCCLRGNETSDSDLARG